MNHQVAPGDQVGGSHGLVGFGAVLVERNASGREKFFGLSARREQGRVGCNHVEDSEAAGEGVVVYLRQEGRGIGLINKLRAYALQDQGFDTVDANTRLGFAIDARDFSVAARMLTLLGQDKIRLLTNNPEKVGRLQAEGIEVVERVPHKLPPNPHNARYLETKRDRTGHAL